ncbi:unnamed protein product [Phaedon cochleariae]|uniref:Uncharacterized protein n=1 Tax=Phaedon cochleariae TaxID=80249 RepID=A0A9N9SEI2_PHACE|nr:unnamed protein product [Phaedon cochleariae]
MKEHWTNSDKIDKIYGPIYDSSNSKWRLGCKEIDFDARTGYIKNDGEQVKGTPGIYGLIFYDVPENYNKDDLYDYKQILELSKAHLNVNGKIKHSPRFKKRKLVVIASGDGGLAHTPKGDIDFGYFNLCNVKTPILKKDAANKEYVDQIRNNVKQSLARIQTDFKSATDEITETAVGAAVVPTKVQLEIENVELKVKRLFPNDQIKLQLLKAIKADTPILIPFRKWELHMLPSLTTGATNEIWAVKTSSFLESPRYVIVCFQTGHDLTKVNTDPTIFNHANITNITLTLNGESYPKEKMQLAFDKGAFPQAYFNYTQF